MTRMTALLLTGLAIAALTACGANGSDTEAAAPSPSSPSSSAATPPPTPAVKMTIADHALLTHALPWQVQVNTTAGQTVQEVDFLVDGKQRWVEHEPPYSFDDDSQLLAPWLLGQGKHVLTAHVVTGGGLTADLTAHVVVRTDVSRNRGIAGVYRRTVTRADQRRVAPYRVATKGAFGEVPPVGTWTIRIMANGEILGIDPSGNAADPFIEPFTLSGSTMRVYGPAVWRQPNPDSPSLFCEPEVPSDYTWTSTGSSLTIRNVQRACADRDIVLVGTWTRS